MLPLDLYIRQEATWARCRTKALLTDSWNGIGNAPSQRGHRRVWDDVLDMEDDVPGDYIPPRRNWTTPTGVDRSELIIYTDGSKVDTQVGAGWAACKGDQVIEENMIRLEGDCSVFQAEVTAIADCLTWLSTSEKAHPECLIRTDSQAALQAINSTLVDSATVLNCKDKLEKAQENTRIGIEWVKGHNECTGNELADHLAKEACGKTGKKFPTPRTNRRTNIKNSFHKKWQKRWNETTCSHTKAMMPEVNTNNKMKKLVKLPKSHLNLLIQVTTGHSLFAKHLAKWRQVDKTCRLCLEEEETPLHIYLECPALCNYRRQWQTIWNCYNGTISREKGMINYFQTKVIQELLKEAIKNP